MNLQQLGFNDWFSDHASTVLQPEQSVARVMSVDRNAYIVRGEGQDKASVRGGARR